MQEILPNIKKQNRQSKITMRINEISADWSEREVIARTSKLSANDKAKLDDIIARAHEFRDNTEWYYSRTVR